MFDRLRKSQSSVELLVITIFVLILVAGAMYIAGIVSVDMEYDRHSQELDDFAQSVIHEFEILQKVEGGYSRLYIIEDYYMERFNLTINNSRGFMIFYDLDVDTEAKYPYYYDIPVGYVVYDGKDLAGNYYLYFFRNSTKDGDYLVLPDANVDPGSLAARPYIIFEADDYDVGEGTEVNLTWDALGAVSCEAFGDWVGIKDIGSSEIVNLPVGVKTFTLICNSSSGLNSSRDVEVMWS